MNRYLQLAGLRQEVDQAIRQRSEELEQNGLKAIDALHVACAEAVESDYFITCDKRLINRCSGEETAARNLPIFSISTQLAT